MKQQLFFILLTLLFSLGAKAEEQIRATTKTQNFSGAASIDHTIGFKNTIDQTTVITADLRYKLNKRQSLRLLQRVSKLYEVDYEQSEVQPADTILFHYFKLFPDLKSVSLSWGTSATIPLSEPSRDNQLRTTISGRLIVGTKLFNERLTLSYVPYARYYVNKYKQSITGSPVPLYGIGNYLLASLSLLDKLSLVGLAGAEQNYDEKGKYRRRKRYLPGDGLYYFDLYADYAVVTDSINLRVGYSQAAPQLVKGGVQINFFDEDVSQYYLGLDYTF